MLLVKKARIGGCLAVSKSSFKRVAERASSGLSQALAAILHVAYDPATGRRACLGDAISSELPCKTNEIVWYSLTLQIYDLNHYTVMLLYYPILILVLFIYFLL